MAKNDFVSDDASKEVATTTTPPAKKPASLYEKFASDQSAESVDGITLDYGEAGKIIIHRAGGSNQRYKNYAAAKLKPYQRQIQAKTMDEAVTRAVMADVYAKTVIVGWEEVRGRDGELLPFTPENVKQVLIDLPDLFDDIQTAANDASLFREANNEAIEGN